MNKLKLKWLAAALLAAATLAGKAHAVISTATLNIDVTIAGAKSVTVNGVSSSTANPAGFSWNGVANTSFTANSIGSSATVTNNSGIFSESWSLSTNATSIDTTGGGQTWNLAGSTTSVGASAFAVQAVFGSSDTTVAQCPATGATDWSNSLFAPPLTAGLVAYVANGAFADSNLNTGGSGVNLLYNPDSGNNMLPVTAAGTGSRALCWKVILPASTTTSNEQDIQIIVSAQ